MPLHDEQTAVPLRAPVCVAHCQGNVMTTSNRRHATRPPSAFRLRHGGVPQSYPGSVKSSPWAHPESVMSHSSRARGSLGGWRRHGRKPPLSRSPRWKSGAILVGSRGGCLQVLAALNARAEQATPVRTRRRVQDPARRRCRSAGGGRHVVPSVQARESGRRAFLFALWRAAGGFVCRLRRCAAARCQVLPGMWPCGGHGAEPGQLHPTAHQRSDPGGAGRDRR